MADSVSESAVSGGASGAAVGGAIGGHPNYTLDYFLSKYSLLYDFYHQLIESDALSSLKSKNSSMVDSLTTISSALDSMKGSLFNSSTWSGDDATNTQSDLDNVSEAVKRVQSSMDVTLNDFFGKCDEVAKQIETVQAEIVDLNQLPAEVNQPVKDDEGNDVDHWVPNPDIPKYVERIDRECSTIHGNVSKICNVLVASTTNTSQVNLGILGGLVAGSDLPPLGTQPSEYFDGFELVALESPAVQVGGDGEAVVGLDTDETTIVVDEHAVNVDFLQLQHDVDKLDPTSDNYATSMASLILGVQESLANGDIDEETYSDCMNYVVSHLPSNVVGSNLERLTEVCGVYCAHVQDILKNPKLFGDHDVVNDVFNAESLNYRTALDSLKIWHDGFRSEFSVGEMNYYALSAIESVKRDVLSGNLDLFSATERLEGILKYLDDGTDIGGVYDSVSHLITLYCSFPRPSSVSSDDR